MTGLIVALAGYLVHDVHERVPFVPLDSLEALAPNESRRYRLPRSVRRPHVVVALLPEDAAALDQSCSHITGIWRTKLIGFS